ncbi:hypothetical protein VTN49DRAFT_2695 [Thermomyces lanuginosus]|uniref:uncharacterized protein n=1 Tax=Thermomyces lanuginosus TaxID=5541 RepID=UPI0037428B43
MLLATIPRFRFFRATLGFPFSRASDWEPRGNKVAPFQRTPGNRSTERFLHHCPGDRSLRRERSQAALTLIVNVIAVAQNEEQAAGRDDTDTYFDWSPPQEVESTHIASYINALHHGSRVASMSDRGSR